MSGHTATPWIAENVRVSTDKCTRKDAPKIYHDVSDGEAVCQLFDKNGEAFSDAKANAAFIVTACNSHADLVKALEEARGALEGWLAFAEEELGEFDIEECESEKLCPKCESAGCINLKIRETRAALATLTARKVG